VLALITEGHLERHIRRARRRYAEVRALLREGLAPVTTGPNVPAQLRGLDAGLHVCLELAPGLDQSLVVTLARRRGVAVATLDDYYHGPPDRQGFILGYGGLAPEDIVRGTQILAEAIAECWG
jgi:GntR family transcriptional regulator/MocR family aminotransferase